jgi:hypothetical protein
MTAPTVIRAQSLAEAKQLAAERIAAAAYSGRKFANITTARAGADRIVTIHWSADE